MKPPLLCGEHVYVLRPNWELMRQAYDSYRTNADYGVCPRIGADGNNCAVRMSIALDRCGSITFDYFGDVMDDRWNRGNGARVHHGGGGTRNRCGLELPHVPGAAELARHIRAIWGQTCEVYRDATSAPAAIANRHGILFFEDCFKRDTDAAGERSGDHIDLWDGTEFWNVKLGISAGGGEAAHAPLFDKASEVWFLPL